MALASTWFLAVCAHDFAQSAEPMVYLDTFMIGTPVSAPSRVHYGAFIRAGILASLCLGMAPALGVETTG